MSSLDLSISTLGLRECLISGVPLQELADQQHIKQLPLIIGLISKDISTDQYDCYNAYDLTRHFIAKKDFINPVTMTLCTKVTFLWNGIKRDEKLQVLNIENELDSLTSLHTYSCACQSNDPLEKMCSQGELALDAYNKKDTVSATFWINALYHTILDSFPIKQPKDQNTKAVLDGLAAILNDLMHHVNREISNQDFILTCDYVIDHTLGSNDFLTTYLKLLVKNSPKNILAMMALSENSETGEDDAFKLCKTILDNDPKNIFACSKLGTLYFNGGKSIKPDLTLARSYLEKAIALKSDHFESLYLLGKLLQHQPENLPLSKKYFKEALEVDSNNIDLLRSMAELLSDDTSQLYDPIIAASYFKRAGICMFNTALREKSDFKLANTLLDRALSLNPKDVVSWAFQGQLSYHEFSGVKQNAQNAQHCFEKVLELDPNNTIALEALANIFNDGFLDIKADKEKAKGYFKLLGSVLFADGSGTILDKERALKSFLSVLSINPRDIEALTTSGRIYVENRDLRAACKCFQIALKLDPKNRVACKELGNIFFQSNIWTQAVEFFTIYLQCDPRDSSILHKMGTIYKIGGNGVHKDFSKAKMHFEELLALDSKDIEALKSLGEILMGGGNGVDQDFSRAKECYKTILTHDPKHGEALKNLKEIVESESKSQEDVQGDVGT